jgi:hypothetical protein
MPNPRVLPLESNNRQHDLALVNFFLELKKHAPVKILSVDRKLGECKPDIVLVYQGILYYVEVQLTINKGNEYMRKKLALYEKHIRSGEYSMMPWQPKDRKVKPVLWIHSPYHFDLESNVIKIQQTKLET